MNQNSRAVVLIGNELMELYPKLLGFAISKTRNPDSAEDLVMDVITKLVEKSENLDIDVNLESYAIRAIRNKFIDKKRIEGREVNTSSLDTEEGNFLDGIIDERTVASTFSIKGRKFFDIEYADVKKQYWLLEEKCLEILRLAAWEYSYKEISELIDESIGTVGSRITRCRVKLLLKLEGS